MSGLGVWVGGEGVGNGIATREAGGNPWAGRGGERKEKKLKKIVII